MNLLKNKYWAGIRRKPGEEDRNLGKTVLEEAGKCGKTWSEVKKLASNIVTWR
jgi:hypothetical protein